MSDITERIKVLVSYITKEHRRFKELEELTGISAGTWRNFWNTGKRPSSDLLEALCLAKPSNALWLMTGKEDRQNKQVSPITELLFSKYKLEATLKREPIELSEEEMEFLSATYDFYGVDELEELERKVEFLRTYLLPELGYVELIRKAKVTRYEYFINEAKKFAAVAKEYSDDQSKLTIKPKKSNKS